MTRTTTMQGVQCAQGAKRTDRARNWTNTAALLSKGLASVGLVVGATLATALPAAARVDSDSPSPTAVTDPYLILPPPASVPAECAPAMDLVLRFGAELKREDPCSDIAVVERQTVMI